MWVRENRIIHIKNNELHDDNLQGYYVLDKEK